MNKQNRQLLSSGKWLVASAALVASTPAFSEYYMGLEATYMDGKTLYSNGTSRFELAPARIKFGYRAQEFGWEIQALTPSEDDGPFTTGGLHRYELRGGLGAMFTLSTPGRGLYAGFGFTQILSDYSVLVNGVPGIHTTTSTPFSTYNLGAQYAFNKNTRITFDYTFYHGDIHCNFCIRSPNLPAGFVSVNPDVRLSTYALGLSYTF